MRILWIKVEGYIPEQSPRGPRVWLTAIIPSPREYQKSKRETEAGPPSAARAALRALAASSRLLVSTAMGRM